MEYFGEKTNKVDQLINNEIVWGTNYNGARGDKSLLTSFLKK